MLLWRPFISGDVLVNLLLRKIFHGILNEAISLAKIGSFTFTRKIFLERKLAFSGNMWNENGEGKRKGSKKSDASSFRVQLRGLLIIFNFLSPAWENDDPSKCYDIVFRSNSDCRSAIVKYSHLYLYFTKV